MYSNNTKVIFVNLGEIKRGIIIRQENDMFLIKSRGKHYLVSIEKILRRILV